MNLKTDFYFLFFIYSGVEKKKRERILQWKSKSLLDGWFISSRWSFSPLMKVQELEHSQCIFSCKLATSTGLQKSWESCCKLVSFLVCKMRLLSLPTVVLSTLIIQTFVVNVILFWVVWCLLWSSLDACLYLF